MDWAFSNYPDALREYWVPLVRSLCTPASRRSICLILGYVLAYAIAFKSGRWKNLMLVLVIAPFFTSFLVRTLSWKLILADNGFIVNTLQFLHILGADGRLLATPVAVVAGLTYNFLPFMVLPLFASIDKIDHRLIEAASDLYANPVPGFFRSPGRCPCRAWCRDPADLHPRRRRLHQRPAARFSQPAHDRQRHPEPLHRRQRLPRCRGAVDDPDAADRGDGPGLHAPSRDGGPALMRWLRDHLVLILGILVLLYTFVPIFIVILMSFNDPDSRLVYSFDGFTLRQLAELCEDPSDVRRRGPFDPDRVPRHPGRHHPRAPSPPSPWSATSSHAVIKHHAEPSGQRRYPACVCRSLESSDTRNKTAIPGRVERRPVEVPFGAENNVAELVVDPELSAANESAAV